MARLAGRQPFLRVAAMCAGLGLLFLFVGVRMLVEGNAAVDEALVFAIGAGLVLIAFVAVRRWQTVMRHQVLVARAAERAGAADPRSEDGRPTHGNGSGSTCTGTTRP